VTLDHGGDEGFLAPKVLVVRTDADVGDLGDAVGAGLLETVADQNASGRLDQRVDGGARSRLQDFPQPSRWRSLAEPRWAAVLVLSLWIREIRISLAAARGYFSCRPMAVSTARRSKNWEAARCRRLDKC
jgi:hypothetical protein